MRLIMRAAPPPLQSTSPACKTPFFRAPHPIREETGLPPPPESGVRPALFGYNGRMLIDPPLDNTDIHLYSIALLAIRCAKARKLHEESKSDPTKNVSTGQALYALETGLTQALDFYAKLPNFYDEDAEKRVGLRIRSVPAIEIPG